MRSRNLIVASGIAIALSTAGMAHVSGALGANSTKLRSAVTLHNVRAHQKALQDVADANGGTRASGTPGFDASLDYVKGLAEAAGYLVTVQPFEFAFYEELAPSELSQTNPSIIDYVNGTDFLTMDYSGSGDVTAVVQAPAGIVIPATDAPSSTHGCDPADFAGFVAGNIALIQRGGCFFIDKVANAEAAGASGVIIFNEGNAGFPDRIPLFGGTLGTPVGIPAVSVSYAFGVDLYNLGSPTVRIKTTTTSEIRQTANLIAETRGGRRDRVVVVGAHLDSVGAGAGNNDNGSASAGILEVALQMKKLGINPRNKLRFIWFGAEESGLLGAAHYVGQLSNRQLGQIMLNLNFDMIGSPNYVSFIYDGDGSDTGTAGPTGSATIEGVFQSFFSSVLGRPFEATAFDGRSDYGPFIDAGIPAGGLFTGAEDIKTPEQAALFGGTAGLALDPCYHQACDVFDPAFSNSLPAGGNLALDFMSDAIADSVLQFAMTTSDVRAEAQARSRTKVRRVAAQSLPYKGSRLQQ